MKLKHFKFIFILLLVVFLVGCVAIDNTEKIINDVLSIKVDETYQIELPEEFDDLDSSKNIWFNSNDEVLLLTDGGIILGVSEGESVVTVTNKRYVYRLFVNVYVEVIEQFDELAYKNELYEITSYIRKQMASVGDEFFEPVFKMDGYDFTIQYFSLNPELLDMNGHYVRGLVNQPVLIKAVITYKGRTSEFNIQTIIEMIPAEKQRAKIQEFINEQARDIIASEYGNLPTLFSEYGLQVSWKANQPGVVGNNSKLYPAYDAVKVNLVASYSIGGKVEEMSFNYTSKGTKDKVEYVDRVLRELIQDNGSNFINTIYGNNVDIIQDFIYPDSVKQLRPGTGKQGTKMPGGPQYVVIHDTGMTGVDDNADGLNRYIHEQANSLSGRVASWHFSIDDTKAYQHVPTDEIAWHAGDGSRAFGTTYFNEDYKAWSIGGGNQNGIGIETCINPGNNYELTLKRTAKLTASLLLQYGLGLDRIKQHNNFSGKNCPAVIRGTAGLWETFLKDVEVEYFLMQIAKDIEVKWESSHPQIVNNSGKITKPINDTNVKLKLTIKLDGIEKVYNYYVNIAGYTADEKAEQVYLTLLTQVIPSRVSSNVTIPTVLEKYQATISWTSDKPEVLSETGIYTKPATETTVKLIANISINGKSYKKEFTVKVS